MVNDVREFPFAKRDVRQTDSRFEVSTVQFDYFLQRQPRLTRIAALEKALANQR